MLILKLHAGDLSTETLKSIKSDLDKYAHLAAYKATHKDVCDAIRIRVDEAKRERNATNG